MPDGKEVKQDANAVESNQVKKPEKKAVYPTLKLTLEYDIAYDFSVKVYSKFNKIVKSIVLFGSTAKRIAKASSDIDIIIIVDDCTIRWDEELIAWYREELGKIIQTNPYNKALHINTVRLSTWWSDLIIGDPVVINVIRYGQTLIDFGGFFNPLKVLLDQGKIKSTPEAIYVALQRAPLHLARSRAAILAAIEGLYWAMVDSAHGALIAAKKLPPSPEQISDMLRAEFVSAKLLDVKYVDWYRDMYALSKRILHGSTKEISGKEVDIWQKRAEEFVGVMAQLIRRLI